MQPGPNSIGAHLADPARPCAFVLSGGGAYGAVQVGMLRALHECGVRPDLVVGSSVGALNGSMVALDPDGAVDRLTEIWSNVDLETVFGPARRGTRGVSMAARMARTRTSLFSDEQLARLIARHAPANTFVELAMPFAAMVTDHLTGEARAVTEGRLGPALAASAAIPGVLPPVEIGGTTYVDGGVAAMFPTRQARRMGAETIVLLDATPNDPRPTPPAGLVDGLIHSLALTVRAQKREAVDSAAIGCPVIDIPSATPPDATAFDFGRTAALVNDGYHRALGALCRPMSDFFGQTPGS